jgi:RimJ/RimL family protein N-acetyltransferase
MSIRSVIDNFPMPIMTNRLLLRPPRLFTQDAQNYFDAVTESLSELNLWLSWPKHLTSIDHAIKFIQECTNSWITKNNNDIGLQLFIIDQKLKKLLGGITIWNIIWEIPKFEFGFWLRTSETQKGYMSEAINALTQYCFLELGIKQIEIYCEIKNHVAQLVPKKLNFKLEKILKNDCIAVADGQITDRILFSRSNLQDLPKIEVRWGD